MSRRRDNCPGGTPAAAGRPPGHGERTPWLACTRGEAAVWRKRGAWTRPERLRRLFAWRMDRAAPRGYLGTRRT